MSIFSQKDFLQIKYNVTLFFFYVYKPHTFILICHFTQKNQKNHLYIKVIWSCVLDKKYKFFCKVYIIV